MNVLEIADDPTAAATMDGHARAVLASLLRDVSGARHRPVCLECHLAAVVFAARGLEAVTLGFMRGKGETEATLAKVAALAEEWGRTHTEKVAELVMTVGLDEKGPRA